MGIVQEAPAQQGLPSPYGVGLEYTDATDDTLEGAIDRIAFVITEGQRIAPIVLTTVGCFPIEKYLYANLPPKWRIFWRKGITSRPSAIGFTDWEPVFVYGSKVHRHAHDLFTVQPELMGEFGHPCPKPIGFAVWLVSRFCDEGRTVVDPFMGSGTTLVAAKRLGRRAIGVEIEERYCEIAARRIQEASLPLLDGLMPSQAALDLDESTPHRSDDWMRCLGADDAIKEDARRLNEERGAV